MQFCFVSKIWCGAAEKIGRGDDEKKARKHMGTPAKPRATPHKSNIKTAGQHCLEVNLA